MNKNRIALLLALLLLSISWLFLIDIFTPPDLLVFSTLVVLSTLLISFHIYPKIKEPSLNTIRGWKKFLLLLVLLIITSIFIKPPYNIGPIFLTASFLILLVLSKFGIRKKIYFLTFWSLTVVGSILSIFALIFPMYAHIVARSHDLSLVSYAIFPLVKFFHPETYLYKGVIFVQSIDNVYPFTVTTDKVAALVLIFYILSFSIYLLLFERRKKALLKNIFVFLVISVIYTIIRYTIILFVYLDVLNLGVFWDPMNILLSFLPLPFILVKFVDLEERIPSDLCKMIQKKHEKILLMVFTASFLLTYSFYYQDPGAEKGGKIVIDELHSDWENTTRPLNKTWYGTLATYNYYSWVWWMKHYYNVTINQNHTLTYSYLKNFDILILKCPTRPYLPEEIEGIIKFVESGGGLYIIGDHTNVFGMSSYFYPLIKRFGIEFNFDATYDYPTYSYSEARNILMSSHPIIKNVRVFKFLTSCTISAPLFTEDVIVGHGIYREPGTYASETFFRGFVISPDEEAGLFLQAVALRFGKGRVVAFSDSTVFSSFCIFMDGYNDFNLGVLEYLNRENKYWYVPYIMIATSIALFFAAGYICIRKRIIPNFLTLLVLILLSFSISLSLSSFINDRIYVQPEPKENFQKVCFLDRNVDMVIDPHYTYRSSTKSFNTLFVVIQRLGLLPALEKSLIDATDKSKAIVIINPNKLFSIDEINALKRYVEKGGNLLLMDSVYNTDSTSNQILLNFGMRLEKQFVSLTLNTTDNESRKVIAIPSLTIESIYNDTILIRDHNTSKVSIAYRDYGNGRVVVIVDSSSFSNAAMGGPVGNPTEMKKSIYNTAYYVFEKLLKLDTIG